eukprot:3938282-Rhodomonas_salina.2
MHPLRPVRYCPGNRAAPSYAIPSTDEVVLLCYASAMRCPVQMAITLWPRYAMSGTDVAYDATRPTLYCFCTQALR